MALTQVPIELSSTPGIVDNSNATAITIDSSENVGIGTDSPNTYSGYTTLTLNGTTGSLLDFEVNGTHTGELYADGTTVFGIQAIGSRALNFKTDNTERMRIDSSGNVGIGTDSPVRNVSVFGSASAVMSFHNSTTGSTITDGLFIGNDASLAYLYNYEATPLVFGNNDTERMRIDSSGRLLVNQTVGSAAGAGVKMQVATDLLTTGAYAGYFWENRSGMTITSTSGWGGWYSTGTASHFLFSDDANRASIGRTSGTYTALSDVNKKKDFEDSTVGLAAIMQLQPKKFRMLDDADDAPKYLGFVAQDVENVIPEAYVEDTSVDAGGVENTFIGLTDRPFIAALVKAIQEQQATITALEARITQLENN